jgi:hypothetical protein
MIKNMAFKRDTPNMPIYYCIVETWHSLSAIMQKVKNKILYITLLNWHKVNDHLHHNRV